MTRILCFTTLFVSLLFLSCSKDLPVSKESVYEDLDSRGSEIMSKIRSYDKSLNEWKRFSDLEAPLPNSVEYLYTSSFGYYSVIPVINRQTKELVSLLLYQCEKPKDGNLTIFKSEIVNINDVYNYSAANFFLQTSGVDKWREKGIKIEVDRSKLMSTPIFVPTTKCASNNQLVFEVVIGSIYVGDNLYWVEDKDILNFDREMEGIISETLYRIASGMGLYCSYTKISEKPRRRYQLKLQEDDCKILRDFLNAFQMQLTMRFRTHPLVKGYNITLYWTRCEGQDGFDYVGGGHIDTGGSGSGGGTTPPPEPEKPKPPKLAKDNIPNKMPIQKNNRCVTSVMAFVNKIFGGTVKENVYIDYYKYRYGIDLKIHGVRSFYIKDFVNAHFNTTSFSTFKTAVDNGYLVMVPVEAPGPTITINGILQPKDGHNILVIGYNSDGTLVTMNPLSGKRETISESSLLPHYRIVITGNK